MKYRVVGFGVFALLLCATAPAQGVSPVFVSTEQPVESALGPDAARLPDGTPYGCFAINTRAGDEITITLRSKAFDSGLQVARGALCSASALQFDNDNFESGTRDARVQFTAAGGRYLILALGLGANAQGAFKLEIANGKQAGEKPASTLAANDMTATSTAGQAAAEIESQEVKVDRRALMQQQVAAHRAELAAEEARRKAIEAQKKLEEEERAEQERLARYERSQRNQQMFNALMNGLTEVANEYVAEQNRIAERNARYAEIEAANRRQREAEAEAARAQMLAKQAAAANDAAALKAAQQREAQQRAAAKQAANDKAVAAARPMTVASASTPAVRQPSSSTSSSVRDSGAGGSSASNLIATPEAIVVCTKPDAEGRFECDTPADVNLRGGPKSDLHAHRTVESMIQWLSGSCAGARRLASATHLVWGCGYGATGLGLYMDRSAGVDVKGRQTFYCHPKEAGCRRTTP